MKNVLITINAGLTIVGVLPVATLAAAYSFQLSGFGGQGPYTFESPDLAAGTMQLASNGTLSGMVTTAGTYPFTIKMRDSAGRSIAKQFNLQVLALPLLIAGVLPNAQIGDPYSATLTVSGGVVPYGVAKIQGPSWMTVTLSGSTITINGLSDAYKDNVKIRVTDNDNVTADFDQQITVMGDEFVILGAFLGNVYFPISFHGRYI